MPNVKKMPAKKIVAGAKTGGKPSAAVKKAKAMKEISAVMKKYGITKDQMKF